jgi:hypothetical protein
MQWKEYRVTSTRVATGHAGAPRRVLELLDGRCVIELEGAPSQIVKVPFEEAQELALALLPVRAGLFARFASWLRRLFGGAS